MNNPTLRAKPDASGRVGNYHLNGRLLNRLLDEENELVELRRRCRMLAAEIQFMEFAPSTAKTLEWADRLLEMASGD